MKDKITKGLRRIKMKFSEQKSSSERKGKCKRGFTLIELIVVMAVIAILVLLAAPKFLGYTQKAEETKHIHTAKVLETALDAYLINGGEIGDGLTIVESTMLNESATNKNLINTKGYIVSVDTNTYYELTDDFIKANLDIKLSASRSIPFIIEAQASKVSNAPNAVYASSDGAVIINKEQTLKGYIDTTVPGGDIETPIEEPETPEEPKPYTGLLELDGEVVAGQNAFIVIKNEELYTWGSNGFEAFGNDGVFVETRVSTPSKLNVDILDIKKIEIGNGSVFILKNDGTIWSRGYNISGTLGLGDTLNRTEFEQIPNFGKVVNIEIVSTHIIAVTEDGSVYGWGNNGNGELGLLDKQARLSPTFLFKKTDIKELIVGPNANYIIDTNGRLWTWGFNLDGRLGTGKLDTILPLTFVASMSNVKTVVTDGATLVVKNDGTLWAAGWNGYGVLGLGDTTNRSVFTKVPTLSNIVDIGLGNRHAIALDSSGQVYSWGSNLYAQLGLGDSNSSITKTTPTLIPTLSNIREIYKSQYASFAVGNDGKIYSWGGSGSGQLGLGDLINRNTPTLIPTLTLPIK